MSMVAMAGSVSGATVRMQKRFWGLCTGCSVGLVAAGHSHPSPPRSGTAPQCHPVATKTPHPAGWWPQGTPTRGGTSGSRSNPAGTG